MVCRVDSLLHFDTLYELMNIGVGVESCCQPRNRLCDRIGTIGSVSDEVLFNGKHFTFSQGDVVRSNELIL